jgi:hypothetical protein
VKDDPSDGLMCKYAQIMDGNDKLYEGKGVNHREQTNTSQMNTENGTDVIYDIFNLIWDRFDVFETERR